MIDKRLFLKTIKELQKSFTKEDRWNDALDAYDPDGSHCCVPARNLFENAMAPILTYSLGLDPNNNEDLEWIYWFVFEINMGKVKEEDKSLLKVYESVTTPNGESDLREFLISSPSAFYDFVKEVLLVKKEQDEQEKEQEGKQ